MERKEMKDSDWLIFLMLYALCKGLLNKFAQFYSLKLLG